MKISSKHSNVRAQFLIPIITSSLMVRIFTPSYLSDRSHPLTFTLPTKQRVNQRRAAVHPCLAVAELAVVVAVLAPSKTQIRRCPKSLTFWAPLFLIPLCKWLIFTSGGGDPLPSFRSIQGLDFPAFPQQPPPSVPINNTHII